MAPGIPAQQAIGDQAEPESAPPRRRILLAEDNPANRKVAVLQIKKLGFAVEVAQNGRQAADAYVRAPDACHLILMDVQMPEMDGYATTRAIRDAEATLGRHIWIIAMAANATQGDRELCLAAGMDGYLSKPVTLDSLSGILSG